MSGRIGGTVDDMNVMAGNFTTAQADLDSLVARISAQLDGTDWEGGAASRFREQWNGEFKATFTKVSAALLDCSNEVKQRATALTQAGA